ncbi:ciliary microtubule-associated protein 3-like isoform X2 [Tachysurus vachellii]|uniref:ciliary microtubule-associated protein 3-like isoform X2 n=1 Tax=Tachysurus vachellii TaxID=175792 RepID=UPI00296AA7F1|nr:ciliary microtubule-associated protein 3-like isoform X2 [Tachysurus vachellii]
MRQQRNEHNHALSTVTFGSRQERKIFPTHSAPNRMGNEMLTLQSSPTPGPGCYDNHVVGTIVYNLERRPESKKGYTFAARTAPRFLPSFQTVTPSPQQYQQDWSVSQMCCSEIKTPFNSTTPRFISQSARVSCNPGPGTYMLDGTGSKRVSWPMKFGSPDWARVPTLERKALRTELPRDMEFQKHRSRVAYLRLYYP